jgi:hypothetical protein
MLARASIDDNLNNFSRGLLNYMKLFETLKNEIRHVLIRLKTIDKIMQII